MKDTRYKVPEQKVVRLMIVVIAVLLLPMLFYNCSESNVDPNAGGGSQIDTSDTDFTVDDWTETTHSKSAVPDFDEVFDNTTVKRLDIVISSARWSTMLDDLGSLYGNSVGPGGDITITTENPVFVPAEVYYNGKQWYRVGVRFKGNSSLQKTWQVGFMKYSFKLDFDEFEDDYPQINNQRFYGFKKLSLKNNFDDQSFLREKVGAEVFANMGLASSHTAFYTLYVDFGDGPQYFGLYTMVEEVDDTVIETQFNSDKGNLYKPENAGASFVEGTFNESGFEKKTNEIEADWSDIQSLFAALHDGSRTTDPAAWRYGLDAVFDTDVFMKYLAVNTVIQNWDSYGRTPHNYFLYNNPDNGKLTWIPWDNNEALQNGKQGGALNLDFSNIQSGSWPLIEYLYGDEVYKAKYDAYVAETIAGSFEAGSMQSQYDTYEALIESAVTSEASPYTFLRSTDDFYSAISTLKQHVVSRTAAVENYLK
jgi:spore coat protein H